MTNFIVLDSVHQWNEISKSDSHQTILLMFSGENCMPCKQIKPRINQLSREYHKVLFLIIDVERFDLIAEHFNINSMPTFIIIKNNSIYKTIIGGDLAAIRHALN